MAYGLELQQGLSQQLNQFQLQSLNILSLDKYELDEFLQNEFAENPLLEYKPQSESPQMLSGNAGGYRETERPEIKDESPRDKKTFFMEQLHLVKFTRKELDIMTYLIDCLEDSGLLHVSLEEISDNLGVPLEEIKACHDALINLEPAGVFARNLEECLMLQLERKGLLDDDLEKIILEHLSDVATGHIASITRTLGLSTVQARKYIQQIQQLNPRPFSGYSYEKAEYIVPDIIIQRNGDEWKIELNDNWIGNYSLNDYYLKMMKEIEDPELKEYFQKKYERSRFIIASIEQRRQTITKIVWAVFKKQKEYFTKGGKLKPMCMQDVADETQMHVSTVSRASKGKYIQSPFGTVSIKDLFASSYSFGNQWNTADDIKEAIWKLIQSEDPKKPYSDLKISQLLLEKEMKISRRTVAKYRKEMGILGTYSRKDSESFGW